MDTDKIYKGNLYEFKVKNWIKNGGNGEVYEVNILNSSIADSCVVKVLSLNKWWGAKKKERYERFYKEIETVMFLQENIPGIMKILDFHCPKEIQNDYEVWYLMYKARSFREFIANKKGDLRIKLKYLLNLSNILCALHDRGYSHRDIKIDNLLILDNELMLSDFGLVHNINDEINITGENERLGPYYIGPRELERRDLNMNDFMASDVFLFAKVVWSVLKNDTMGFRGAYKRDNKEFYLNALDYGITTFEPVHQLLEQSTQMDMLKRISIQKCKELLSEQLLTINQPKSEKAKVYRFNEVKMEIVNNNQPDLRVYRNFDKIFTILDAIIAVSHMVIEGADELISADSIQKWRVNDRAFVLKNTSKSVVTHSYLCYPDYIEYSTDKEDIKLYIKAVSREVIHSDFISYKERKMAMWGGINSNIFLDETLVIRFKSDNKK